MSRHDSQTRVLSSALFNGTTPNEMAELLKLFHRLEVPAGSTIIAASQPGELLYLIERGSVKVSLDHDDGTEIILAILGAGEIVGEMSVMDSNERSASVTAMERCVLLWMDSASFWVSVRAVPQITYNMLTLLTRRLRLANTRLQLVAKQDVAGRLAQQLLAFAQEYGERAQDGSIRIPLRLTQSDLAGLTGASRIRINQVMVDFKRQELLSVDRNHRITLLQVDALTDFVQ